MTDLLERRQQREEVERAMEAAGRLPPGQALTLKFPVLYVGDVPYYDLSSWDFRVSGEVETERRWTWQEFQQLPRTTVTLDIHCVTQWSKFDTEWEGVSIRTLVDEDFIRLTPATNYVIQHCEQGYTTNIPLEIALADNFLLATHFNGEPLEPDHGYPLRGVVGAIPGRDDLKTPYLWKGGKWLRGLEFVSRDRLGYWEQVGYHNEADVWKEQRMAPVQNHI